jgi:hypothetical protein
MGGVPDHLDAKQVLTVAYKVICKKSPASDGSGSGGGCKSYQKPIEIPYKFKCSNGIWSVEMANVWMTYTYKRTGVRPSFFTKLCK